MGNIFVPTQFGGRDNDFAIFRLLDDKFFIVMPFPDRIIVRPLEDVNEERKGDDLEMATDSGFLLKKGQTKKSFGGSDTTAPTYER
jgi:hypothetical protein